MNRQESVTAKLLWSWVAVGCGQQVELGVPFSSLGLLGLHPADPASLGPRSLPRPVTAVGIERESHGFKWGSNQR